MEKFILAFLLIMGCNFFSNAQVTWQTLDSLIINSELPDTVSQYYKYIHKAENFIIRNKFDKAAENYQKAFTFIKNPFLRDLSNAIRCEVIADGNKELVMKYIWQTFRKTGITEYIVSDTSLLKLPYWKDIRMMLDTIKPVYDTAINQYMKFIKENDQDYRSQCSAKYNGNTYNEFTIDSIRTIDSINYYRLIDLCAKYGHLTEELTGNQLGVVNLILMHNREKPELYLILYKSVLAGKMSAINYSYFLNDSRFMVDNKFKSGDKDVWQLNNGTFLALKTDRKTKKLKDEYRTKLFVDDIDTYTEKIIWQFCNEDSNFNFFNNRNEMMDEEDYFQVLLSGKIRGLEVEIYYRTPEIKRQLLKEAQAWQKEQNKSEKFSAE
jgi:hypothetical protein